MSKATFGVRQPLKSLEFGTLLHNIVRKGVYQEPICSVSNDAINISGGVFLLYDTDTTKSYAVRIEDVSLTLGLSSITAGQWLFLSYTYNAADTAEPLIYAKSSIESTATEIRLGRLIQTSSGYSIDTSSMEKCFEDDGFMNYFNYNNTESATTPQLVIGFARPIVGATGLIEVLNVNGNVQGIDKTKAQYLYIDTTGAVKCADASIPRFGKLVIAEKEANANFTVMQFPTRTETNAWDIELTDHSTWSEDTKENTIYQQGAENTSIHYTLSETSHIIALSGLVEAMVSHIGTLERQRDNLEDRVTYLENLVNYFAAQVTIPSAEELVTTPTASKVVIENVETKSTGEVNIKGAVTVDSNTSSFGTADNPIHNLYVTTSLYTDQLFVTE